MGDSYFNPGGRDYYSSRRQKQRQTLPSRPTALDWEREMTHSKRTDRNLLSGRRIDLFEVSRQTGVSPDVLKKMKRLRGFLPYLKERKSQIEEQGRSLQLQEELETIQWMTEVITDVSADENFGLGTMDFVQEELYEMVRQNPIPSAFPENRIGISESDNEEAEPSFVTTSTQNAREDLITVVTDWDFDPTKVVVCEEDITIGSQSRNSMNYYFERQGQDSQVDSSIPLYDSRLNTTAIFRSPARQPAVDINEHSMSSDHLTNVRAESEIELSFSSVIPPQENPAIDHTDRGVRISGSSGPIHLDCQDQRNYEFSRVIESTRHIRPAIVVNSSSLNNVESPMFGLVTDLNPVSFGSTGSQTNSNSTQIGVSSSNTGISQPYSYSTAPDSRPQLYFDAALHSTPVDLPTNITSGSQIRYDCSQASTSPRNHRQTFQNPTQLAQPLSVTMPNTSQKHDLPANITSGSQIRYDCSQASTSRNHRQTFQNPIQLAEPLSVTMPNTSQKHDLPTNITSGSQIRYDFSQASTSPRNHRQTFQNPTQLAQPLSVTMPNTSQKHDLPANITSGSQIRYDCSQASTSRNHRQTFQNPIQLAEPLSVTMPSTSQKHDLPANITSGSQIRYDCSQASTSPRNHRQTFQNPTQLEEPLSVPMPNTSQKHAPSRNHCENSAPLTIFQHKIGSKSWRNRVATSVKPNKFARVSPLVNQQRTTSISHDKVPTPSSSISHDKVPTPNISQDKVTTPSVGHDKVPRPNPSKYTNPPSNSRVSQNGNHNGTKYKLIYDKTLPNPTMERPLGVNNQKSAITSNPTAPAHVKPTSDLPTVGRVAHTPRTSTENRPSKSSTHSPIVAETHSNKSFLELEQRRLNLIRERVQEKIAGKAKPRISKLHEFRKSFQVNQLHGLGAQPKRGKALVPSETEARPTHKPNHSLAETGRPHQSFSESGPYIKKTLRKEAQIDDNTRRSSTSKSLKSTKPEKRKPNGQSKSLGTTNEERVETAEILRAPQTRPRTFLSGFKIPKIKKSKP